MKFGTIFLLFFLCFPLFSQTKHPIFSDRAPKWAAETHFVEGNTHYFVGRSSKQKTVEESISKALANALSLVSKYVKADVRSLSKIYEEASGDANESFVTDVFSERGAQITVRNYIKESYSEKFSSGVDILYESVVKIGISDEDIKLLGIKATGITAWNLNISNCNGDQAEELEMIFKEAASRLNWKLLHESSEKPDFGKKFPKTAYFAEAKAKCTGNTVTFSVERYDLVENMVVTFAYSKANTVTNLKTDLFNSLQIYVPLIDFPEYPDPKNVSLFNNVQSELRNLYSDAVEAEQKGRLNSEKAEKLWTNIAEYGGNNPFRNLAQNRVSFYKKMTSAVSKLSSAEKKEFEILKKTANSPTVNIKMLAKNLSLYIDSFGAWAGSAKVNEIIDIIDKEKKTDLLKAVFEDFDKAESWEESCRQGDPAKCYILSMKNDGESTSLKKYACNRKVEKACFDLYSAAKNNNRGNDAALFAEKSCYLGNQNACLAAAGIFFQGQMKVNKDVEKSLRLLEDSCEARSGESCYMLGVMYDGGTKSIKKNKSKAIDLYKKSCDLGFKKSCNAY